MSTLIDRSVRRALRRAAFAASLGTVALFGNVPFATAAEEELQELEEVQVTGSRIVRRDFEANSPILTVDEALLKNSSTSAIETQLAKLPQFRPVQTPTIGGDIQPTALNTPGAATVSLRGLGANRNLVLLDGRRATPGNASQVVDINTIPSLAIERIEVITGGASATYGADAVGGVANFIMRKDFEGAQFDASTALTQRGDGFEYQIGGVLGANLADGRGNVMLAFATNKRDSSERIDRPWFSDAMRDPTIGGDEFFPDFSGYNSLIGNDPTQASYDAIFGPYAAGVSGVQVGTRLYFNPDGTAFTGFFQSFDPTGDGVARFLGDTTGTKWKQTANGQLGQNFQDALLVLPLQRDNVFVRGDYDITDSIGFFAQGLFSKVRTRTVQQPSPSVNGWAALIPNDGREIPDELADVLATRDEAGDPWQLTYYLNQSNREARVDVFTYNMLAGLKGRIPGTDWTWDIHGSTGESETSSLTTGVASLARFRAVISSPDWGAGFVGDSNPLFAGFGANFATCTSGIDPFNKDLPISDDCIAAISADLKTRASLQQDIWEANTQGKVVDLPAGELRAAVGASYRKSRYEFLNDTLTTQGSGFLDQAIGIYPSGNAGGEITAKEIYGELLVPVIAGLPFAQKVELELGVRSSDYNTTGSSTTWKALADWRVVDWLRFRGGFNRAERSPNVGELYLAPSQTFQIGAAGDLCSLANASPYSANPANGTQGTQARALCDALMERAAPGTAAEFYSNPQFFNSVGPAFAFPSVRGNPGLIPEKANTWTIGTVFSSPFDSELLDSLRVSIDYYDIKVKDAIGPQSVDIAQRQCFDPTFNPGLDVASPFCDGINRVANDGALGNILLTFYNNGRFTTRGVDTQIDWGINAGPGRFTLNSVFTYLIDMKTAELISDPLLEYAGALGPTQNELNSGSFEWKFLNTFSYGLGKWSGSLQWQHLPSIKSINSPIIPNTTVRGAGAYNLLNLSGSFNFSDDVLVRFGIDNLLDKAPPLLERNSAPPPGVLAGGTFGGANATDPPQYDFIGRRFYLGATLRL